jgi:hypothetical protein
MLETLLPLLEQYGVLAAVVSAVVGALLLFGKKGLSLVLGLVKGSETSLDDELVTAVVKALLDDGIITQKAYDEILANLEG